jgi:UDP-N-acetyl-2-amino-2-deoxyglucuronate dehydrogenase
MTIQIGIIGCGAIAEFHIRAIQSRSDCRIVACCDTNLGAAQRCAKRFQIPLALRNPSDLLAIEDLHLVAICVPPKWHLELLLDALKRGLHVIIEKPLATTLLDADTAVSASLDGDRLLGVALIHRYQPAYAIARDLIQSNAIGDVKSVEFRAGRHMYSDDRFVQPAQNPRGWLVDPEVAGGGMLMSSSIHFLSVIQYVLNDPVAIGVEGHVREAHPAAFSSIEDDVELNIELAGGIQVSYVESWTTDVPLRITISGADGRISIDANSSDGLSLQIASRSRIPKPYDALAGSFITPQQLSALKPTPEFFTGLWEDMIEGIGSSSPCTRLPSLIHARNLQAIVEAAYSAEEVNAKAPVHWRNDVPSHNSDGGESSDSIPGEHHDNAQLSAQESPSRHVMPGRRSLLPFIFGLVACQGATVNIAPLVMGVVAQTFPESQASLGLLQTSFMAGGIMSLLVSGYVTDFIYSAKSGTIAVIGMVTGLVLLGLATTFPQVVFAIGLIGLGNAWILAVYSSVIAASFQDVQQRMFMWATAAFALTAAIGNYATGFSLARVPNWQLLCLALGVGIAIIWMLVLATAYKDLTTIARQLAAQRARGYNASRSVWDALTTYLCSGLLDRWVLWLLGFLVILDNLAGGGSVTWTAQLFRQDYGINEEQASVMIAASALGVFIGRVLLGAFVCGKFTDLAVLGCCYAGAVIGYALLLLTSNFYLGVALCFLCGALMSAQAPTMYSLAVTKFGNRAATAIPLIDAIGLIGSFMGPAIVGALADRNGLREVLWFIPATGILFVAIVLIWDLRDRANQSQIASHSPIQS